MVVLPDLIRNLPGKWVIMRGKYSRLDKVSLESGCNSRSRKNLRSYGYMRAISLVPGWRLTGKNSGNFDNPLFSMLWNGQKKNKKI